MGRRVACVAQRKEGKMTGDCGGPLTLLLALLLQLQPLYCFPAFVHARMHFMQIFAVQRCPSNLSVPKPSHLRAGLPPPPHQHPSSAPASSTSPTWPQIPHPSRFPHPKLPQLSAHRTRGSCCSISSLPLDFETTFFPCVLCVSPISCCTSWASYPFLPLLPKARFIFLEIFEK